MNDDKNINNLRGRSNYCWIDDPCFLSDTDTHTEDIPMNKYRRKETIVSAKKYELGMEDGFVLEGYIDHDIVLCNKACSSFGYVTKVPEEYTNEELKRLVYPYIRDKHGNVEYINKGDYIIISDDGQKKIIPGYEFEKDFELLSKDVKETVYKPNSKC